MHLRESSIDKERFSNGNKRSRCPLLYLKAMQEELEYLKTVRRKELAEETTACSHGDLSENSEYDEAKNTQGLGRTASPS